MGYHRLHFSLDVLAVFFSVFDVFFILCFRSSSVLFIHSLFAIEIA